MAGSSSTAAWTPLGVRCDEDSTSTGNRCLRMEVALSRSPPEPHNAQSAAGFPPAGDLSKYRRQQPGQHPRRPRVRLAVTSGIVREVDDAAASAVQHDRHVHDRADAQAEDQLVVGERGAQLLAVAGDEHLATVEHLLAPRRALLLLAAADRIGA